MRFAAGSCITVQRERRRLSSLALRTNEVPQPLGMLGAADAILFVLFGRLSRSSPKKIVMVREGQLYTVHSSKLNSTNRNHTLTYWP